MIDYELLKSLPIDEGMAYLRRMLAGGMDDLNPDAKMVDYYADNPNGVVGEGGRFEGSGVLSERLGILESTDPTRSYVARFSPGGDFLDVGQQGADSWYDKPVGPMGLPLGALLPLAAAGASAYFAPATAAEGVAPAFMEGASEAVVAGGASGDALVGGEILKDTAGLDSLIAKSLTRDALMSALPAGLLGVLKVAAPFAPVIGAIAGAATSGDKQQTTSQAREPWAPAQDWLKSTIADGQTLSDYYKRQPFNDTQKSAYQNLFNDIGNYRTNIAPGIFELANNLGKPYQVQLGNQQPGVRPEPVSGQPAPNDLAALLNNGTRNPWDPSARGIFGMGTTSPYGQIDWNAMNPFLGLLGG